MIEGAPSTAWALPQGGQRGPNVRQSGGGIVGLGPMGAADPTQGRGLPETRRHFAALFDLLWVLQGPCQPPLMDRFERLEPLLRRKGQLQ